MPLYYRRLAVGTVDLLHRRGDLPDRRVRPHRFYDGIHRVLARLRGSLYGVKALLDLLVVAPLFKLFEALELVLADLLRDAVGLDVLLVFGLEGVDVDDVALLPLDLALVAGGGVGDLTHLEAFLDGLHHPAKVLYLLEVVVRL